jgi:hypothetical protein
MCAPNIKRALQAPDMAAIDQMGNQIKELEYPSVAQMISELAISTPSAHGSDEIKLRPEEEEEILGDIQTTFQEAKGSFTFEYYSILKLITSISRQDVK